MFPRPLLAALLLAAVAACAAPPKPTGPGPGDLTGTRWQLARWQEPGGGLRPIPHGSDPITLQFGETGGKTALAGFAGCNQFNGPYEMAGDRLVAGAIVATKRACVTPQRNELETAFLAALDDGVTVTRETDDGAPALQLKTETGETLTFRGR